MTSGCIRTTAEKSEPLRVRRSPIEGAAAPAAGRLERGEYVSHFARAAVAAAMMLLSWPSGIEAQTYENSPFDAKAAKLQPSFQGADVEALLKAIDDRRPKPRGEFEKKDEYDARVKRSMSEALLDDIKWTSTLAFVLPLSARQINYDIDKEQMNFADPKLVSALERLPVGYELSKILCGFNHKVCEHTLVWSSNERDLGTYQGSNAFGAMVTVKEKAIDVLGLSVCSGPFLGAPCGKPNPAPLSVKMDVEKAKVAKNSAAALVIGQLVPPYAGSDRSQSKPTRSDPTDKTENVRYLKLAPSQLWIFDRWTGEIFKKAAWSSLYPAKAAPAR